MKTLYLECGMGAAGDMLTAALLELMPDPEAAVTELNGLGIPGVQYIGVAGVSNPVMVFALCAVFGVALFLAGYGCWQLLVLYVKGMGRVKTGLSL